MKLRSMVLGTSLLALISGSALANGFLLQNSAGVAITCNGQPVSQLPFTVAWSLVKLYVHYDSTKPYALCQIGNGTGELIISQDNTQGGIYNIQADPNYTVTVSPSADTMADNITLSIKKA